MEENANKLHFLSPLTLGGWWRWALVSPDGVAPSRIVWVSASVNLPLHHKVQKFSSGTGSPGWSRKKGRKTVVVVVNLLFIHKFWYFWVLKIAILGLHYRQKGVLGRLTWQSLERLRDTRKRSIASECLLRCRPTFSKSLMVSEAVSKLGCSLLFFFVEPSIKVDDCCYRNMLMKQQMLPVMRHIPGDTYVFRQYSATLQQETPEFTAPDLWPPNSPDLNLVDYGVWVSCRNQFTRLQCMTQLTSSSASLSLGRAFHRLSSKKSLMSGATTTNLCQSKGVSLWALAVTNRLFSEPPTFYRRK